MSLAYQEDPPDTASVRYTFTRGGDFIFDAQSEITALWGEGDEVLLADGEALIIAGPQGTGKTTLAQQLALGRCGLPEYATLLGRPVVPGARRTLYLAMDRPRQAARSFRRMVGTAHRPELDDRLLIWHGPPPHDLARVPAILTRLAEDADADTVVVDSLKDAALGLTDDEVGSGYNRARQHAIRAGVQVIELHHQRKAPHGAKAEHPSIDDIYGSTWITSGAGSVLLLAGRPGDPIVTMHHVKQPLEPVGPLKLIHDHTAGHTALWHSTDLVLLAKQPGGLTAVDAAKAMYDTDRPDASQKESARRKLTGLTKNGLLQLADHGDKTTNKPARWEAA